MADTHRYQIADLVLETNIPLPEVTVADGSINKEPECRFRWMDSGVPVPKASSPYHRWLDSAGKPFAWFYHRKDGYQIRVLRTADFVVSTQADEIRCYARGKVPVETVRQVLLTLVLPVTLSQRGRLSLHASAVAMPDGAVGFLGGGGSGKSTLAARLFERGYPLLCDDSMVVKEKEGRIVVVPGEPLVRLYVLVAGEEVRVERMKVSEVIVELIKCTHLLDVTDQRILKMKLGELTEIAEKVACFRLVFPHDYSMLDKVCAAVVGES